MIRSSLRVLCVLCGDSVFLSTCVYTTSSPSLFLRGIVVKHILLAGLLAAVTLSLAGSASTARAIAIRLSPLPERVALADAVVVGKVTVIEDKTISVEPFPGTKDKVEY